MPTETARQKAPLTVEQVDAVRTLVRHTTYQAGSLVCCAVCSVQWPCFDVREARKVLGGI